MLEQIKSPVALHELNRRKRKGEIEKENYRVAHKLYSTKAALKERFDFKKDFAFHMKVKTLRCKFPVIDMKQNRFNAGFDLGRPPQSTKNALGPRDLVEISSPSYAVRSPESPRILNKLSKRPQRMHYNSIDITNYNSIDATAHTAAGDTTTRQIEEEEIEHDEPQFENSIENSIENENV